MDRGWGFARFVARGRQGDETVLIVAALGLSIWTLISRLVAGGAAGPVIVLVLAVAGAVVGARRLTQERPALLPLVVAACPLAALAWRRTTFLGDGPLGYANASGSLFFVGACAAVLAASRARSRSFRVTCHLAAATWILVPWLLRSDAAALLGLMLPLGLLFVRGEGGRARTLHGLLLRGGAAAVIAGFVTTVGLGASAYAPADGERVIDRLFDRHVGELRVELWSDALRLIGHRPVTGVGPGRFIEASADELGRGDLRPAHNEYLQIAAETGLPGGLLLWGLLGGGFVLLARARAQAWPASLALSGTALHANIDFIWHHPEVPLALALLVGAGSVRTRGGTPIGGERVASLATSGLWLVLLLPLPGINPAPTATNGAAWNEGAPGLAFPRPGAAWSVDGATAIHERLIGSRAITIEAWAGTAGLDQGGPARIFSSSAGPRVRNLTLGQEGDALVFRLRTSRTDRNGRPALEVPRAFEPGRMQHLVVATDLAHTRAWVDGQLRWDGPGPGGNLDVWDVRHRLIAGNEATGDRVWLGELRSVRIHERMLEDAEVRRAFLQGPGRADGDSPAPLVEYVFEPNVEGMVVDRAPGRLGPDLHLPERVPAPTRTLPARLADPDGEWVPRVLGHGVLFLAWGSVMLLAARPRRLRAVARAGFVLALAGLSLRNLMELSPAVWDLLGTCAGLAGALGISRMKGLFAVRPSLRSTLRK